jgi:hypothetical protein
VKRFCGEDTWRVASWNNSSVPGSFFQKTSSLHMKGFFAFLSGQGFEWYFALCHQLQAENERNDPFPL